jgi:DNA-binding transcriptional ArsR family regulator
VRLTKSALQIFLALETGATSYTRLIEETGLARSTVSREVTRLSELGLVGKRRDGGGIVVEPQATALVESLGQTRESVPHIDLAEFLTPARLRILWFLSAPRTVSDITPFVEVSQRRVRQVLTTLRRRQMATETDRGVQLRLEYESLQQFAATVFSEFRAAEIRSVSPDATTLWSSPNETLYTTPKPLDDVPENTFETGLRAFSRWGLTFRSSAGPMYYETSLDGLSEPSVEKVIAHTLVRRADGRRLAYCTVLLAEAVLRRECDPERLERVTEHCGVGDLGRRLVPLVAVGDDGGRVSARDGDEGHDNLDGGLSPSPDRIRTTAKQYGVDIDTAASEIADSIDANLWEFADNNQSLKR